jgi:transcription termination factor Rho
MRLLDLKQCSTKELGITARALGIENPNGLPRNELIYAILKKKSETDGEIFASGILEIHSDGFGFLRSPDFNYRKSPEDIYVGQTQVKRFGLREGDEVSGQIRPSKEGAFQLIQIDTVNGQDLAAIKHRPLFDNLTAIHPARKFNLICGKDSYSNRIIELTCPIGFGQRCLIVAPPKTGKTVLLQDLAEGISSNHKDVVLIALLIGERPEEVTEMTRTIKGEVASSTFDEPAAQQVRLAEAVMNRAKRMVEIGKDVVILLDSITRLARAYNTVTPPSGKVMTGGLDVNALHKPKQIFGAARNLEEGGSLTIIATALIDTGGSKQDDIIYEEFKGTGNSEIHLDRKLMERRVFPCLNIKASGTRKDHLLVSKEVFADMTRLRTDLAEINIDAATQILLSNVKEYPTNEEVLEVLRKSAPPTSRVRRG